MKKLWLLILIGVLLALGITLLVIGLSGQPGEDDLVFNEKRAWQHLINQLEFGPRTPGSDAHEKEVAYIQRELLKAGWTVEVQETQHLGISIKNIIAKRGSGTPWIIFGAHYDSRFVANQDADVINQTLPVPGANDGASGVAVLLEMARVLPKEDDKQVWLVFFDAEDQGRIEGWDWILGSKAFVASLDGKPDAVVVIDMIGDTDLNIYREQSSDQTITDAIWQTAANLGYENSFINEVKYNILDDHLPFLEAGIPAIDIIDFDYPYWHTTLDTADKISAQSLAIVGNTLLSWLENYSDTQ